MCLFSLDSQEQDSHEDMLLGANSFGSSGEALPAHVCAVEPGQVVLANHSLFHSAYYHYPGRTFFAVKFAQQPTEDKHHASNMRYARDTCRARPALLLQHRALPQLVVWDFWCGFARGARAV